MFKLIVGLGNPGEEYHYTRHNLGSLALEEIADYYQAAWREDKKWQARLATAVIAGKEVVLMLPNVYMNNSGAAVGAWAQFHRVRSNQIVIMHDELDLTEFEIRSKLAGGLNGHNGLRSVVNSLGNSRDFARIRFGIGRPTQNEAVADFVLSRLSGDAFGRWRRQFDTLITALPAWLDNDGQDAIIIGS